MINLIPGINKPASTYNHLLHNYLFLTKTQAVACGVFFKISIMELSLPAVLRRKLPPNLEAIKNGHYTDKDPDYPIHMYLQDNDIRVEEKGSEIVQFLKGKNILITGATGFIGKALLEKLLRSCKDIGKIFIFIRNKKGEAPETRLNIFLDNWIFKRLSYIYPDYKEKVVGVHADLELDGLGLTENDYNMLTKKVDIIYHAAAMLRFDEFLKKAVTINVKGTQQLLHLAKKCKHLTSFVHVSTAFANCNQNHINEEIYPPYLDPYVLMSMTENVLTETLDSITPGLLGSIPNTYAFTKQISEDLIRREGKGLPISIHRPSIVIASYKEPIRSWMDNIYSPIGMLLGVALGFIHSVYLASKRSNADYVPVDYVVNSLIACCYKTAKEKNLDEVKIYNYTCPRENSNTWHSMTFMADRGSKFGSQKLIMIFFLIITPYYYWHIFLRFWVHTVPAYLVDLVLIIRNKRPIMRSAYAKYEKFVRAFTYFMEKEWTFSRKNVDDLWSDLNEIDKRNFPFEMHSLNWQENFVTFLVGLREFIVKDFLDTLEEGKRWMIKLHIILYGTLALVVGTSSYFFFNTVLMVIPVCILIVFLSYCFYGEPQNS